MAQTRLTPRQRQVLYLAAKGHKREAIAGILGVSLATVRNHLARAQARLNTVNVTSSVAQALAVGEIPFPSSTSAGDYPPVTGTEEWAA